MNKGELINAVASSAKLSKTDAESEVNAIIETISNTLAKGETVQLVGFGTFSVKERAAREGRNPHTGESIKIAASKAPAFKPSKALKEKVAK